MELLNCVWKQAPDGDWERREFTGNGDHFVFIRNSVNWGQGPWRMSVIHTPHRSYPEISRDFELHGDGDIVK